MPAGKPPPGPLRSTASSRRGSRTTTGSPSRTDTHVRLRQAGHRSLDEDSGVRSSRQPKGSEDVPHGAALHTEAPQPGQVLPSSTSLPQNGHRISFLALSGWGSSVPDQRLHTAVRSLQHSLYRVLTHSTTRSSSSWLGAVGSGCSDKTASRSPAPAAARIVGEYDAEIKRPLLTSRASKPGPKIERCQPESRIQTSPATTAAPAALPRELSEHLATLPPELTRQPRPICEYGCSQKT
jgi:hypothetical protein